MEDLKIQPRKLNLNMDIPRGHLFIVILILFLIGDFSIGFAIGGTILNNAWKEYNKLYEEKIERDCICLNKTVSDVTQLPFLLK